VADTPAARSGATVAPADRRAVVAREKDRYGGIKWGSAFFGWLTATGTAVILTALLLAAGATVGIATGADTADARGNAATIGLAGGLTLLAVILVAYFCGGYVAGRMARFSGAKQGIAVWIWAVVIAVAVAVAGAALGDRYDLLDRIGGFPRLPIGGDNVTTGSIVAVVIALVAALAGAILGGLAGMRYHRRVDEAGLGR
jgi:membrane protease YdiL (CAAX protease family)